MFDEEVPRKAASATDALVTEDLYTFSIDQLQARIAVLEAEIIRTQVDIDRKSAHMAAAEGLFKK